MSVGASLQSAIPARPVAASPPFTQEVDSSSDARGAAWIERGRLHDLAVRQKMRIGVLGAAVIALLAAVIFGLTGGAL